MYVDPNFKTKKAFKEAFEAGQLTAESFWQPGPFGTVIPENGKIHVEGPHYPEPHRWYAEVIFENGKPVKVK
jgi:hypothetical protein